MIFIIPLLVIFLTIWGLNTFYFDAPKKPIKPVEKNETTPSAKAKDYFKKYIDK